MFFFKKNIVLKNSKAAHKLINGFVGSGGNSQPEVPFAIK